MTEVQAPTAEEWASAVMFGTSHDGGSQSPEALADHAGVELYRASGEYLAAVHDAWDQVTGQDALREAQAALQSDVSALG